MRPLVPIIVASLALSVAVTISAGSQPFSSAAQPTPKPSPSGPLPLPTPPGGPPPAPVPPPTTMPGSRADLRQYTNTSGSWRVEIPAAWRITAADDPAGAIITTFDPRTAVFQNGLDVRTRLGVVPPSELRVNVDVWPNADHLTVGNWVDRASAGRVDGQVKRIDRSNTTISGQPGVVLVQQELSSDRNVRLITYYVVASRDGTNIYVISMHPADSIHAAQFRELLSRFEVLR